MEPDGKSGDVVDWRNFNGTYSAAAREVAKSAGGLQEFAPAHPSEAQLKQAHVVNGRGNLDSVVYYPR